MKTKITFLGGGSFGIALAVMLAKKGYDINVWDRKESVIDDINIKRENIKYLPNRSYTMEYQGIFRYGTGS